ncbi:MAG: hypothetical protein H0W39_00985 [Sphingomonas sp.]|nr:hypothetical protein [Sphingomonas sp.]
MATIMWPIHVLPARDVSFDIAPRSLAGPSSVSGFGQVVASDAGIWKATLASVHINSRQTRLAFRAIDTLLEGRLNPILVPLCRGDQPVPAGAVEAGLYGQIPHSDDAFFDDDSGYVGTVIDVVAAANVAARAVSMTVTVNYAGDIEPGQHFSVGERLYRVRSFNEDTGAMTFRPPLREAVTAGERLEFDNPVCRMRLATDDAMNLDLQLRRFGTPTVSFIEDL